MLIFQKLALSSLLMNRANWSSTTDLIMRIEPAAPTAFPADNASASFDRQLAAAGKAASSREPRRPALGAWDSWSPWITLRHRTLWLLVDFGSIMITVVIKELGDWGRRNIARVSSVNRLLSDHLQGGDGGNQISLFTHGRYIWSADLYNCTTTSVNQAVLIMTNLCLLLFLSNFCLIFV